MASELVARVGKHIRRFRRKRGWRLIDLAEHAKISKTHLSDLENGKRAIGLLTLESIANALEVHPADLLR